MYSIGFSLVSDIRGLLADFSMKLSLLVRASWVKELYPFGTHLAGALLFGSSLFARARVQQMPSQTVPIEDQKGFHKFPSGGDIK